MLHRLKRWNGPLINEIFYPEGGEIIKSIPLYQAETTDKYLWHFSPLGVFTVSSVYRVVWEDQETNRLQSTTSTLEGKRKEYGRMSGPLMINLVLN